MRSSSLLLGLFMLGSAIGFAFSAVSAYDSVAHLDRQTHGVHCSFVLAGSEGGDSGCYATLMSSYSAVLRESIWGGIPIALPSLSVFSFLLFLGILIFAQRLYAEERAVGFLLLAALLPFGSSLVMAYISIVVLQVICKLCIGIYVASAIVFFSSLMLFGKKGMATKRTSIESNEKGTRKPALSWTAVLALFGAGVAFVMVPAGVYAAMAPDFSRYIGSCGSLPFPENEGDVLIPLNPRGRQTELIEVLDPLCGACAVFKERISNMDISKQVTQKVLMFPLDSECNWMVDESVHPGACVVSEAVLCARDRSREVLDWAMKNREAILETARKNPKAVRSMIIRRFAELRSCIGSAAVRARLNLALRWAVKNQLQVLTPQVFVGGQRLCDEDTDLGLEYALPRLIARSEYAPLKPDLGAAREVPITAPATPKKRPISSRRPREVSREPEKLKSPVTETDQSRGDTSTESGEDRYEQLLDRAKSRIEELENRGDVESTEGETGEAREEETGE